MDQLNYTEQKNSSSKRSKKPSTRKGSAAGGKKKGKAPAKASAKGKPKAAGKAKKPEVKWDSAKTKTAIQYIKDIIIGIILGAGAFYVILSEFGLSWNHKIWSQGSFSGGLVLAWNTVADTLASADGVFLTKLEGEGDTSGFFLTVILLFLIVMSVLIVLCRVKWMAILFPAMCIIPTLIWGLHASVLSVCIMALGILLLMINTDVSELRFNYRGLLYALVLAFIAFVVISIPGVSKVADRTSSLDNIRDNFTENVSESFYGKSALYDGDLTVKRRKPGDGTALEISMSNPQPMYLRGFVGDVLEKDGWKPLTGATYYDQSNFVYWMHQNNFNGLGQLGQSSELAKQGGKKNLNPSYMEMTNDVTVTNVGTNKKYAYVPYEITIDGVDETKNWGDNFLTAPKYHKLDSYSFVSYDNATGSWTEYASKLVSNRVTPDDQATYMENEKYYNQYVYDKFTYISTEDRAVLSTAMNNAEGDQTKGHVEYNQAIKSVKQLISYNFTYTDELTSYDKKETALRNIFSNLEGYDSQLATAAVMMFRYYGIPARYVEGYLVTDSDIGDGSSISIPRGNAHAWAEIYVDGLGFVPIEVCQEYSGIMEEADYSIGIKTKTKNDTPDMSTTHDEDPNVITQDGEGSKAGKKMPHKAVLVIGILAALLLLILLVWAVVKLVRKLRASAARNRLFRNGEPKEAVRAIYAYMEELELDPDQETVDLGNRATYSEHNVSTSDRMMMYSKIKTLKQKKRADKKLAKARKKIENSKLSDSKKQAKLDALLKQNGEKAKAKNGAKAKNAKKSNVKGKDSKVKASKSKKKQAKKKTKDGVNKYSSYERK